MARYYFLACSLPPMPAVLGESITLSFPEICNLILRNIEPEDNPLVRCMLTMIDTVNAEYLLKGHDVFVPGGNLTREDMERKRGLPSFMKTFFESRDRVKQGRYVYDDLWAGYYTYAYSLAEEFGCRFLIEYLSWEVGLQNSLAGLRAREWIGEGEHYRAIPRVGGHDFSSLLSHVRGQQNPLVIEQFLDMERLKRIFHCEGPDPFSRDAVLATIERARIFSRWEKLNTSYPIHSLM